MDKTSARKRVCFLHGYQCPRGSEYYHQYGVELTIPARKLRRGDRLPLGTLQAMCTISGVAVEDDRITVSWPGTETVRVFHSNELVTTQRIA